jgi:RimJ/RimL family protein N-acetyltransferase
MSPELFARPATLADAARLLEWRNDSATVAASLIQQPVAAEEHAAWLIACLNDPRRRLMIVEATEPVATYRLDWAREVEISLTVAPKMRGLGLSTPVIRLATEHAVREGASFVWAVIRNDNAASRRAFASCGFWDFGPTAWLEFRSHVITATEVAGWRCAACARAVAHHTNATGSIGGSEGRAERWDLHVSTGGGLEECLAGDLLIAWERSRRRWLASRSLDYSIRTTVLQEERR